MHGYGRLSLLAAGTVPTKGGPRRDLRSCVRSADSVNRLLLGGAWRLARPSDIRRKALVKAAQSLGDVSAAHRRAHRRSGDSGSAPPGSLSPHERGPNTALAVLRQKRHEEAAGGSRHRDRLQRRACVVCRTRATSTEVLIPLPTTTPRPISRALRNRVMDIETPLSVIDEPVRSVCMRGEPSHGHSSVAAS
jgi:hypothetical protein